MIMTRTCSTATQDVYLGGVCLGEGHYSSMPIQHSIELDQPLTMWFWSFVNLNRVERYRGRWQARVLIFAIIFLLIMRVSVVDNGKYAFHGFSTKNVVNNATHCFFLDMVAGNWWFLICFPVDIFMWLHLENLPKGKKGRHESII
ncbi:hypothetical protein ACJX0J_028449, partial [Zea mays]